ncbi:MAG: hypothetical protein M1814_002121 [Vezdaea aestivalis]|nr:MAG: hypothetical protein M1814_002121 [Vezdaea aestivalis]
MAPFPLLLSLFSLALGPSLVYSQSKGHIDELSFGHKQPISPGSRGIPHFHLFGEPSPPQVLRDRVILTPPAVGNRRGAIWAETRSTSLLFSASLFFRASGPERGNGNLQLWYTSNGHFTTGSSSIYSTAAFDGLAILISTSAGTAGQIRAFLNDGTVDFKAHHNVESLSFAHCDFSYRNLGVFSMLTVIQDGKTLKVTIDGKPCIETDKVRLPIGNYFGVSAASAEIPDSFEVSKFTVSAPPGHVPGEMPKGDVPPPSQHHDAQFATNPHETRASPPPPPPPAGGAGAGSDLASLQEQVKALSTQLTNIQASLAQINNVAGDRHVELLRHSRVPHEQLNGMDSRMVAVERQIQRVRDDIEGKDYKKHLDEIRVAVKEGQDRMLEGLPRDLGRIVTGSAPRTGFFFLCIVAVQIGLAASYVVYKRRRSGAPKKYL